MSDNFWEAKYLNSEKSIEFLKQTHAEVLKGLHDEIDTLQKQCSEFALKLSLQAPTAIEREEYDKKFRSFNSEYKKKDALIAEQRKLIDERNRNVKSLEERVKTLERRQEIEITNKDQLIDKLRQQLENQSLQIANLTFQMHHLNKNVLAKLNQSTESSAGAANSLKPLSPKLLKSSNANQRPSFMGASSSSSSLHQIGKEKSSQPDAAIYYSQPKLNLNSTGSNRVKICIENLDKSNESEVQSRTNSARTERSTPDRAVTKVLPPVIMSQHRQHNNKASVEGNQSATATAPFLNSTQSMLHSRVKKFSSGLDRNPVDILHRRTLITLPPIQKSTDVGQLAVESPLKIANVESAPRGHSNTATQ